jgi:PadR family transcriptional regulator, regulatory protein PadR
MDFRENWAVQIRKGVLELIILATLRSQRRYGYELVQALAAAAPLQVAEGTVYPILNRLKRSGLVTSELEPSSEGPARKYYRLTRSGEAELKWMLRQWTGLVAGLERYLEEQ